MKYILIIIPFIALGLCSCAQGSKPKKEKDEISLERIDSVKNSKTSAQLPSDIHTEFDYTDSTGQGIIIQNSYPRGGVAINGERGYTDPAGRTFGYGQFWTRIMNKTNTPLELTVSFPADSFAIGTSPDTYVKLLVPQKTMTSDKRPLFNYGWDIKDVELFLDNSFNKPTIFQRKINPNEACIFYVTLLIHLPDNGPIRAGFVLEDQKLVYKIDIDPYGSSEFLCGQITEFSHCT